MTNLIEAYIEQIYNESSKNADKSDVVIDQSTRNAYVLGYFKQAMQCTLSDLNLTKEQEEILVNKLTRSILR